MHDTIELTFDKSRIVTIGGRLYSQSIELIRAAFTSADRGDEGEGDAQ